MLNLEIYSSCKNQHSLKNRRKKMISLLENWQTFWKRCTKTLLINFFFLFAFEKLKKKTTHQRTFNTASKKYFNRFILFSIVFSPSRKKILFNTFNCAQWSCSKTFFYNNSERSMNQQKTPRSNETFSGALLFWFGRRHKINIY